MKKRTVLLTAALIVIMFTMAVFASGEETGYGEVNLIQYGDLSDNVETAYLASVDDANAALYNGFKSLSSSINLRGMNITPTQIGLIFLDVINTHPDLFHVERQYRYSLSGNYVISLTPQYSMTPAQYNEAMSLYNTEMEKIVSQTNDNMTDFQKVLAVHDYIAANYEYDLDYTIYDAYNFLVSGKGVCQSYTLVFEEAMSMLGIPCTYVSSDEINHIWNLVCVDGKWYHVDVTWDDPIYDRLGGAQHTFLLLDDETIQDENYSDNPHTGYTSSIKCTDKTYVDYVWTDTDSPFVELDGVWYYIDTASKTLCSYDFNSGTISNIFAIPGRWYAFNRSSYYSGAYSGLFTDGDNLYFNSYDKIYRYTPGNTPTVIYSPDLSVGYVYGCNYDGRYLQYALQQSPTTQVRTLNKFSPNYIGAAHSFDLDCLTEEGNSYTLSSNGRIYISAQLCNGMEHGISPIVTTAFYNVINGIEQLIDVKFSLLDEIPKMVIKDIGTEVSVPIGNYNEIRVTILDGTDKLTPTTKNRIIK